MAGIAFVVTRDQPETERQITPAAASEPTPTETPTATPTPTPQKPRKPAIQRGKVFVEVYNNTSIPGLAGDVADRATDIGWQVVGSDNWVGTIPANTVYFPPRLKAAGRQLAPRPRHPPGPAGRRRDEARPVDRGPHRAAGLA